ncbi:MULTISPECIES: CGNR zinc finger domain-containing protein [Kitasatospora]|uniref:CGNR zinc finger domain-containing protein n=1 Tax=Kitasatospora TaxID=2063 RepID=UPI0003148008|nr:CGNR zinc finger domain-containing protein [Kitasatospora setae]
MSSPGFRPAQRLIDLANAVRTHPDLPRALAVRLLVRHGERPAELAPDAFTDADLSELRDAARQLADLLAEPDPDAAAAALNATLAAHAVAPRLSRHDGHAWHLHVDRADAGWGEWLLASSALALAQLLTEHGRPVWGECAAPGCRTLHLGPGPGSPRRYCSPACASRTRVAEHRRRRAAAQDGAGG